MLSVFLLFARDYDGVQDDADNCPGITNGDQVDSDSDGKGSLPDYLYELF